MTKDIQPKAEHVVGDVVNPPVEKKAVGKPFNPKDLGSKVPQKYAIQSTFTTDQGESGFFVTIDGLRVFIKPDGQDGFVECAPPRGNILE